MGDVRGSWTKTDFWDRASFRAKVLFFGGVFLLFAPLGVVGISSFAQNRPWQFYVAYGTFSGLTAAGFAYAFTRRRKLLWLVIPSQVLWGLMPMFVPGASGVLSLEGLGTVALIVSGYVLFIRFIAGEGAIRLRLETEMTLARQIHETLIPPIEKTTERFELFGRSLPSSEMGGDLLDVVQTGDRLDICIADVSGHGVRAGVVMGMVKSALRLKLREEADLGEVLGDMNAVVCELVGTGMFVTCATLRFTGDDRAQFAGAGHGPVVQCVKADGTLRRLESNYLPLGVTTTESYGSSEIESSAGDLFMFMTDGLTEVFDASGSILGQEPLEALVKQNRHRPLPEIYDTIMSAVDRFGPRADDQTLLLVRVRG